MIDRLKQALIDADKAEGLRLRDPYWVLRETVEQIIKDAEFNGATAWDNYPLRPAAGAVREDGKIRDVSGRWVDTGKIFVKRSEAEKAVLLGWTAIDPMECGPDDLVRIRREPEDDAGFRERILPHIGDDATRLYAQTATGYHLDALGQRYGIFRCP